MMTGSFNPYEPPKADVTIVEPTVPDEALEAGIAGRYDFANGEVMSEAWALTKGFKASFLGAILPCSRESGRALSRRFVRMVVRPTARASD